MILGAGGAAKAIVYGILKEGGKVYIYNRTLSKALEIKEKFANLGFIEVIPHIEQSINEKVDIIVNATSLGLKKRMTLYLSIQHFYCQSIFTMILFILRLF